MPRTPPCFVPPLPNILAQLANELQPAGGGGAEEALLSHLNVLRRFERICGWKAAKAGKGKDGYARSRYCDELYTRTGLRQRAWLILDLCHSLNIPPPWQLCDLYANMDAPHGLYEFERRPPLSRMKALALMAEDMLDGIKPSQRSLARKVGIPLSTLKTWMADEGWEADLKQELEMRGERRRKLRNM